MPQLRSVQNPTSPVYPSPGSPAAARVSALLFAPACPLPARSARQDARTSRSRLVYTPPPLSPGYASPKRRWYQAHPAPLLELHVPG